MSLNEQNEQNNANQDQMMADQAHNDNHTDNMAASGKENQAEAGLADGLKDNDAAGLNGVDGGANQQLPAQKRATRSGAGGAKDGKADEEMMVENQATGLGEQLGNPAADAQKEANPDNAGADNPEDDQNYQFYKEYCRLYYANIILTNRLQQLLNEKKDLQFKLNRLESNRQAHEEALGMTFDITDERRKRHRRTANEISRHYVCPLNDCPKSYGSEGSLNQHLKIKHLEHYQAVVQANNANANMIPSLISNEAGIQSSGGDSNDDSGHEKSNSDRMPGEEGKDESESSDELDEIKDEQEQQALDGQTAPAKASTVRNANTSEDVARRLKKGQKMVQIVEPDPSEQSEDDESSSNHKSETKAAAK